MEVVMKVEGTAAKLFPADQALYVKSFDVDAHHGIGEVKLTNSKTDALRFRSGRDALDAWKTQSKVRPLRSDGRPNRPLTAYTVTFENVPETAEAAPEPAAT